jgi:hypothetical protein
MNTYPMQNKIEEGNITKHITTNNQYPKETFHKIDRSQKKKNHNFQSNDQDNIKKWATFTYIGRETISITKIFKTTNLKAAFKLPTQYKITYAILKNLENIRIKTVEFTN